MKEKIFKKGIKKRLLSVVLALVMAISLVPLGTFETHAEELSVTLDTVNTETVYDNTDDVVQGPISITSLNYGINGFLCTNKDKITVTAQPGYIIKKIDAKMGFKQGGGVGGTGFIGLVLSSGTLPADCEYSVGSTVTISEINSVSVKISSSTTYSAAFNQFKVYYEAVDPCPDCGGSGKGHCETCNNSRKCSTCNGIRRVPCTVCSGTGSVECDMCEGSGEFFPEEVCPICEGAGHKKCDKCEGKATIPCLNCEALGKCLSCPACTTCNGTGKKVAPQHTWSYLASGNTLTATCKKECGAATAHTATLTLTASDVTYSGSAINATLIDTDGAWATNVGALPTIKYYTDEACETQTTVKESGASVEGGAPVKAGQYWAAITVGTAPDVITVKKVFSIAAPEFLRFTAEEAGAKMSFNWGTGYVYIKASSTNVLVSGNPVTSTDWRVYGKNTSITLSNAGDYVEFKGNVPGGAGGDAKTFTIKDGKIAASGDVTSITNNEGGDIILSKTNFYESMFKNCTALTKAPDLPSTKLASYCYYNMFMGCTALTSAPELPATALATNCYYSMFSGCTSLTDAPELPATTLAGNCYNYMFKGCTSLKSAPELPATTLAGNCYYGMFYDCTSLTNAPELPATALTTYCYYYMFKGCTSLKSAPELPATTLAGNCYDSMFYDCTSLTSAPELPATALTAYCYNSMFRNCTNLTNVPVLKATTLADYCYRDMFNGCEMLKVEETETEAEATWVFPAEVSAYWNLNMIKGWPAQGELTEVTAGNMYKVTSLHIHKWNYFADDETKTIKAYCTEKEKADECSYQGTAEDLSKAVTLTLTVEDMDYTGSVYTGLSFGTGEKDAWNEAKAGDITIKYVGKDNTAYDESKIAPIKVGNYTVKVYPSVEDETPTNIISDDFEIKVPEADPSDSKVILMADSDFTFTFYKDGSYESNVTGDASGTIDTQVTFYNASGETVSYKPDYMYLGSTPDTKFSAEYVPEDIPTLLGYLGFEHGVGLECTYDAVAHELTITPIAHTHTWSHSVEDDSKLVATCTCNSESVGYAGCDYKNKTGDDRKVVLTITANDADYSGEVYESASISGTDAWEAAEFTVPTIKYVGRGNTTYTESETAPTDSGTYVAKISAGEPEVSATADFEIKKLPQDAPETGTGYAIDYVAETIVASETEYEVSTSNEELITPEENKVTPGTTYYVRKKETINDAPSPWTEISVPSRAAAPTGLNAVKPTTVGGTDGKITGVDSTMEYSADTVSYNAITGTEVTGLKAGTYNVRKAATATAFAGESAEVTIEEPHVHTGAKQNGQPATCMEDGFKDYYKCSDEACGKLFEDEECTVEISDLEAWKAGAGKLAALGHDWKYTAEGAKLIVICDRDSSHKASLTLVAEPQVYSETATYAASFEDTEAWTTAGLTVPTVIKYFIATEEGGTEGSVEVTNLTGLEKGNYYAAVTVGEGADVVTAKKAFKILGADKEVFEEYIEDKKAEANGLKLDNDLDAIKTLIDSEVAIIGNTTYDSTKTLEENEAVISAIIAKLKEEIKKEWTKKPAGTEMISPSSEVASDGKITGVNSTMEYSLDGGKTWIAVPDSVTEITGLKSGEVRIRRRAISDRPAGEIIYIIIEYINPDPTVSYTVEFISKGEVVKTYSGVKAGSFITEPAKPAIAGFAGWYKDEACTIIWNFDLDRVKADTKIYAKYTNTVKVTLNPNGGKFKETVNPIDVVIGSKLDEASLLAIADKAVYGAMTFSGWYKDEYCVTPWDFDADVVTEDTTLYIGWGYPAGHEEVAELSVTKVEDYIYTGKKITPAVSVSFGGKVLVPGTDYTVSYKNNVKAYSSVSGNNLVIKEDGSIDYSKVDEKNAPTIIIKGKKNYTNKSIALNFNILPVSLGTEGTEMLGEDVAADICDSFVAKKNGVIKVKGTVSYKGKKLKAKDYTLELVPEDAVDENGKELPRTELAKQEIPKGATGTFILIVEGKDNYTDGFVKTITVKDNVQTLEKAKISLKKIAYSGSDLTVEDLLNEAKGKLTVKVGSKTLVYDKDYTVEFTGDDKAGSRTNGGVYPIIITGQGEYLGSRMANVTVTGVQIKSAEVTLEDANPVYTGSHIGANIKSVNVMGNSLTAGIDYDVVVKNDVKVGKANVTITGKGIYTGTKKISYKIQKKVLTTDMFEPELLSGGEIDLGEYDYYGGVAVTPDISVSYNGVSLINPADYTISLKNNKKALSSASATISGKGNYTGKVAAVFTIGKDEIDSSKTAIKTASIKVKDQTYTGREITIDEDDFAQAEIKKLNKTLTLGEDFEIVDGSYVKNVNVGKAQVIIKGIGDYDGYKLLTFKITKKDLKWWQKIVK